MIASSSPHSPSQPTIVGSDERRKRACEELFASVSSALGRRQGSQFRELASDEPDVVRERMRTCNWKDTPTTIRGIRRSADRVGATARRSATRRGTGPFSAAISTRSGNRPTAAFVPRASTSHDRSDTAPRLPAGTPAPSGPSCSRAPTRPLGTRAHRRVPSPPRSPSRRNRDPCRRRTGASHQSSAVSAAANSSTRR